MHRILLCPLLAAALLRDGVAEPANPTARQRAFQEQTLRMLPKSKPWEEWLAQSGERAPDFDALPDRPFLPETLRFEDGRTVGTRSQWRVRREELLDLLQHHLFGRLPPPPGNVRVAERRTTEEGSLRVEKIILQFGPQQQARLHLELILPKGRGPHPVFVTQDNHRSWALIAASRGYIGCVYAGSDSNDDTGAFVPLWPDYDWAKLARRAWAASRCVDYLYTRPEVDRARIAITGHSRNGKLSLIAAATDERFTAVISSSSGTGGACSYRLFSAPHFGEDLELMTRVFPDWLHPRARFFAGREHKLPVDQHQLLACIAPRPCLISSALNDNCESLWSLEHVHRAARQVYGFLGKASALELRYRPQTHETKAGDIERYLDWLDTRFGRGTYAVANPPIYPTYADWQATSGEKIRPKDFPERGIADLLTGQGEERIETSGQWAAKRQDLLRRIEWGLGESPPRARGQMGSYGQERAHVAMMLSREKLPAGIEKLPLNFGNYVAGDLYFRAGATNAGNKRPAVIWLHPSPNARGYVPAYPRGEAIHLMLARQGFVVFVFDQIGNGNRIEEGTHFYRRYPRWSLLGATVADTRAAVDALQACAFVEPAGIFVLGYATGGMAALHAAALDDRIAGAVSIAGFTPMRLDTAEKGTGGVARWAQWLPLQPRLGAFVGAEARIPYDYHEVLAAIAPRPVLVVTPQADNQSTPAEVRQCVGEARKAYALLNAEDRIVFEEFDGYNRFSPALKQQAVARLKSLFNVQP